MSNQDGTPASECISAHPDTLTPPHSHRAPQSSSLKRLRCSDIRDPLLPSRALWRVVSSCSRSIPSSCFPPRRTLRSGSGESSSRDSQKTSSKVCRGAYDNHVDVLHPRVDVRLVPASRLNYLFFFMGRERYDNRWFPGLLVGRWFSVLAITGAARETPRTAQSHRLRARVHNPVWWFQESHRPCAEGIRHRVPQQVQPPPVLYDSRRRCRVYHRLTTANSRNSSS